MSDYLVREEDFRLPEFKDAKVEDYERRADGKIVRKDRWERGIFRIVSALNLNPREFEIDAVVARVEALVEDNAPVTAYRTDIEIVEQTEQRAKERILREFGPELKGVTPLRDSLNPKAAEAWALACTDVENALAGLSDPG